MNPQGRVAPLSLARARAAMRAVLQASTNAILVVDDEARVTDFNQRFVAMWSVPPQLLQQRDAGPVLDWVHGSCADPVASRDIDANGPPTVDVLRTLDGRLIERHSCAPVLDGEPIGRVWSFVAITDHEQTQQQLREEAETLSWLNATALALSATLETRAVVEAMTRASVRFTGALAASFIPAPALSDLEVSRATDIVAPDCPPGGRSLLAVPIAPRPDHVLGTLALEAPGGFPERVQRLIGALAAHAATAIDNARLHERVRRESAERKLLGNLQRTSTQRLQNLSRRLMHAEEEERKRLGRELHDRVGANLSALGMGLELLRKQLPGEPSEAVRKRMDDLQEILRDTVAHVRGVLAHLRPTALDDLGLLPALRHQARVLSDRNEVQFIVGGDEPSPRLPSDCEIAFYRIAQEAWSNAAKHSGARCVVLTVSQEAGRVTMVIEDDGQGFDPGELPPGASGLGLTTMRERAEAVGAVLEVGTAPGAGVCVQLSLACRATC